LRPSEPTGTIISLFLDIGQGAGLAGATGVRPFLPPLLAGGLALGDVGLDFDRTAYAFLETPFFFGVVLTLAVLAMVLDRRRARESLLDVGLGVVAASLGALLFAGSLAANGYPGWPGLVGGIACALLGYLAGRALFVGARRRLEPGAATLLTLYADAIALALAAVAIFLPPLSLLALVAFAILLLRSRRARGRKFEGLRILR